MLAVMTDEEFERSVAEGIDAIPPHFLKRLDNVAFVVADDPSVDQREAMHLRGEDELLGLYEGIPLIERGGSYGGLVLPDKITIFKNATLRESEESGIPLQRIVRDTVWHEIAHYFGYDDAAIGQREDDGTNWTPKDGWTESR